MQDRTGSSIPLFRHLSARALRRFAAEVGARRADSPSGAGRHTLVGHDERLIGSDRASRRGRLFLERVGWCLVAAGVLAAVLTEWPQLAMAALLQAVLP